MKDFDLQHYTETFASFPFTAIFALNDPQDQLGILNNLIIKHLEEHALMKRIRVTRQSARWMKDLNNFSLKTTRKSKKSNLQNHKALSYKRPI